MSNDVPNWVKANEARKRSFARRREADAFLIWRTAEALRWYATVEGIAEISGLTENRVQTIARDRGWPLPSRGDSCDPAEHAVDVLIGSRNERGEFRHVEVAGRQRAVHVRDLRPRRAG